MTAIDEAIKKSETFYKKFRKAYKTIPPFYRDPGRSEGTRPHGRLRRVYEGTRRRLAAFGIFPKDVPRMQSDVLGSPLEILLWRWRRIKRRFPYG